MRYAFAPVALGLGANALVARQTSTCYQLQASGGASGVLGQLGDGQNRIGGDNPTGCYCLSGDGSNGDNGNGSGGFTDSNGRGCILTPPTTQFQCDAGATPTGGFAVGSNGGVTHDGSGTFYACPVNDNGEYNIYSSPAPGQDKCVEIALNTAGSCGSGNGATQPAATQTAATTVVTQPAATQPAATTVVTQPVATQPAATYPAEVPDNNNDNNNDNDNDNNNDNDNDNGTIVVTQPAATQPAATYPAEVPDNDNDNDNDNDVPDVPASETAPYPTGPAATQPNGAGNTGYPGKPHGGKPGKPHGGKPGKPEGGKPGQPEGGKQSGYPEQSQGVPATTPAVPEVPENTVPAVPEVPQETVPVVPEVPQNTVPAVPEVPQNTVPVVPEVPQNTVPAVPGESVCVPVVHTVVVTAPAPGVPVATAPVATQPAATVPVDTPVATSIPGGCNPAHPGSCPSSYFDTTAVVGTTLATVAVPQPTYPAVTPNDNDDDDNDNDNDDNENDGSGSCPQDLNGNYEYPHMMVPVDSSNPDHVAGTGYNGKVDSHTCTIYNFDIPASMAGKKCSTIFMLPNKEDLETSDYTMSGSGVCTVSKMKTPANTDTTYNNMSAKDSDVASMTLESGNSYTVDNGDCAAGQTVSYMMCGSGDFSMNYFQDWNPSPLGMYVRQC